MNNREQIHGFLVKQAAINKQAGPVDWIRRLMNVDANIFREGGRAYKAGKDYKAWKAAAAAAKAAGQKAPKRVPGSLVPGEATAWKGLMRNLGEHGSDVIESRAFKYGLPAIAGAGAIGGGVTLAYGGTDDPADYAQAAPTDEELAAAREATDARREAAGQGGSDGFLDLKTGSAIGAGALGGGIGGYALGKGMGWNTTASAIGGGLTGALGAALLAAHMKKRR